MDAYKGDDNEYNKLQVPFGVYCPWFSVFSGSWIVDTNCSVVTRGCQEYHTLCSRAGRYSSQLLVWLAHHILLY